MTKLPYLPDTVWEQILLHTLQLCVTSRRRRGRGWNGSGMEAETEEQSSPAAQRDRLLTIHQQWCTLACLNRRFSTLARSPYFGRQLLEWLYPMFTVYRGTSTTPVPVTTPTATQPEFEPVRRWTPKQRHSLDYLWNGNPWFLWRAILRLYEDRARLGPFTWGQETVLWLTNDAATSAPLTPSGHFLAAPHSPDSLSSCTSSVSSSDDQGAGTDTTLHVPASCLKLMSSHQLLLLASDGTCLVLFAWNHVLASHSSIPPSPDSMYPWRPSQRAFVFEDTISIACHLDGLSILTNSTITTTGSGNSIHNKLLQVAFDKCRVCFQQYPLCGQALDRRVCGSCLYRQGMVVHLLDIDAG